MEGRGRNGASCRTGNPPRGRGFAADRHLVPGGGAGRAPGLGPDAGDVYQVAPHLASGALRVVLRDYELPPVPVHVVHPEGRRGSAKVRSFVDFCVQALRRDLALLPA